MGVGTISHVYLRNLRRRLQLRPIADTGSGLGSPACPLTNLSATVLLLLALLLSADLRMGGWNEFECSRKRIWYHRHHRGLGPGLRLARGIYVQNSPAGTDRGEPGHPSNADRGL